MNIQINHNLLNSINNDLLYKSRDNFIDKIVSKLYDSRIKTTNIKIFKNRLTKTYNNKSKNLFTYYIKNHTKQYNMQTNHLKQYLNNNEYIYKNNIQFDSKGNYKIIENKKGAYLDNKFRKSGLKNFAKTKHFQYVNKNKDELFLTLTLPSKYHYFKKDSNGKIIKNNACIFENIEDTLDAGYNELNKIYRQLYKNIKRTLQKNKLNTNFDYIFIIEPHENQQLHIHTLFWVDKKQINIFYKEYKNIRKTYNLNQTKLKYINTKKYLNSNKQKHKTKVSSYLYKYLIKTYKSDEVNEYARYKSYFKNKSFFRTSQYGNNITQAQIDFIYHYLYTNDNELLTKMKEKSKPLYTQIIDLINNKIFVFHYKKVDKTIIDFNHIEPSLLINTNSDFIYAKEGIAKELKQLEKKYDIEKIIITFFNSRHTYKYKLKQAQKEHFTNKLEMINKYQDHYKYFVKSYINEYIEHNLDYIIQNKKVKKLQTIIYTKNNIKCTVFDVDETIKYKSVSQNKYEMFENAIGMNNNELYENNDIIETYEQIF